MNAYEKAEQEFRNAEKKWVRFIGYHERAENIFHALADSLPSDAVVLDQAWVRFEQRGWERSNAFKEMMRLEKILHTIGYSNRGR